MAMADCKQISASAVEKLYIFAQRFVDYNALLNRITYNMLYYGVSIYSDLAKAEASYQAGDYYSAGLYAGEAVQLATQ